MTGAVLDPVSAGEPAGELAGLGLVDLRAHREALRAEEERVSCWRRLVHARIDLIRLLDTQPGLLVDLAAAAEALADHSYARRASTHLRVGVADPIPDVDGLDDVVWQAPSTLEQARAQLGRLLLLEVELSQRRRELHDDLAAATAELVSRYRDDPSAVLSGR